MQSSKRIGAILITTLIVFALPLLALAALQGADSAETHTPQAITLDLETVASGFNQPVGIASSGIANDTRLFIVEQGGRIRILNDNGSINSTAFLDISSQVTTGSERGLLGLTFHPDYQSNGYFYVNYTAGSLTRIARFQVSANPDIADASSQFVLLTITQPFSNHNAGDLKFGPDGYLYIPMGDGGSGGDPLNNAQTMTTLLGKIVRIDVDATAGSAPDCKGSGNGGYTVPTSNPFVDGTGGTCDEIWASGLRNPWRFSFDRQTGDMFIGDVGQNLWEELDFQPASSSGGENYGWRCYEGDATYNISGCGSPSSYTFPIYVYGRTGSSCSVVGGFMYRGSQFPAMVGHYVMADYCSGRFWDVTRQGSSWTTTLHTNLTGFGYTSFGEGLDGEIYVSRSNGTIYHLTETTPQPQPELSIAKTGPASVLLGETIEYTLMATNTGEGAATNTIISDTLPVGATHISGGTLVRRVVYWDVGTIAPNNDVAVSFVVSAESTITNFDYGISADNGSATGTDSVTTEVIPIPGLSITKSGPSGAHANVPFDYTLTIVNDGGAAATSVIVTDMLPTNATYVDGGVYDNGVVSWALDSVSANSTKTVTFSVSIEEDVVNDTYGVSADGGYGAQGEIAVATDVLPALFLTVTKSGPAQVATGEPITYTLDVHNAGLLDATAVVVTDTMPVGANYVAGGNFDGTTVSWNVSDLAINEHALLTFVVTATETITNSDYAVSAEPNFFNTGSPSVTTVVRPAVELALSKDAPAFVYTDNPSVTYTLTVTNSGIDSAQAVVVTDVVPFGATHLAGGVLDDGVVTWEIGELSAETTTTVSFTVSISQTVVNSDYAVSATGGFAAQGANAVTTELRILNTVDLALAKAGPADVVSGELFTYTLTVTNTGTTTATNVILTDTVPTGVTYVSGGTLDDGIVTWHIGSIASNTSATRFMVVRANPTVQNVTAVNSNYGVISDEDAAHDGNAVTTVIHPFVRYLPILLQ